MAMDRVVFDSITELAERVAELHTRNNGRCFGDSSTRMSGMDFFGGMTPKEAVAIAADGGNWQAGADAMPRVHLPHERLGGGAIDTPELFNSVQGFAPNVPNYLTGQPDSMMNMHEPIQGTKLLRVAVHVGRLQSITQEQALNRGAAIMAVLDQLSKEGYSLELWAVWRNELYGQVASVETCIKHGTDYWTPSSVAFALCHVAFQRRLCWRVAESMLKGGAKLTDSGYGNGMAEKFKDFDLHFPYVTSGGPFETPEKATTTITRQALDQLATMAA